MGVGAGLAHEDLLFSAIWKGFASLPWIEPSSSGPQLLAAASEFTSNFLVLLRKIPRLSRFSQVGVCVCASAKHELPDAERGCPKGPGSVEGLVNGLDF